MASSRKEDEVFSRDVLLGMIEDFRNVLSRAEAKLRPPGDDIEDRDPAMIQSGDTFQGEKGKERVLGEEREIERVQPVRNSIGSAETDSVLSVKGEERKGPRSDEEQGVRRARTALSSLVLVENDRSTGEPYRLMNPSDFNGNAQLGDDLAADSPNSRSKPTSLPPEEIALTGARTAVDEVARVPHWQNASPKDETAPPLGLPEGWQSFLKWFEAIDKESEKPESGQTRWAKFWRRLKDQVFNEQAVPPDGWAKLWKRLRAADEEKVRDYKEDIDSLLILAGLFSAIVTAFLIAFYVTLQPDSKDTTAFLVYQISLQLSSAFPIVEQTLDATQLSLPSFPFQIPASTVRINAVWFASLICALTTASFGILVKQWLREYMAIADMKPDKQCRVRYLREVSLYRWGVHHIASFLPLLLQGAIILFFVGLLDFARLLHPTIGGIVIAFVAVYLLFFVGTTLAPIVDPHCPYRTPFLNTALQIPRYLIYKVGRSLHSHVLSSNIWRNLPFRTRLLDAIVPESYVKELQRFRQYGFDGFQLEIGENRRLDIPCMLAADAVLHDDDLAPSYKLCLDDLHWEDAIESTPFPPQHTPVRSLLTIEDVYLFWQTSPYIIEYPARLAISQFIGQPARVADPGGKNICVEVYSHLRSAMRLYRLHRYDRTILSENIMPKLKDRISRGDHDALGVIRLLQRRRFNPRRESLEWCTSPEAIVAIMEALCSYTSIKNFYEVVKYGTQIAAMAARAVPATKQAELKTIVTSKLSYLVSKSPRKTECTFGAIQAISVLAIDEVLLQWCSSPAVICCLLDALGSPIEVLNYYRTFNWLSVLGFVAAAIGLLPAEDREVPRFHSSWQDMKPRLEQSIDEWLTFTGHNHLEASIKGELEKLEQAIFQPHSPLIPIERATLPTPPQQKVVQESTIDYKDVEQQLQENTTTSQDPGTE